MKTTTLAIATALLCVSGAAAAAVTYVSGTGRSYDYSAAFAQASADALGKCAAQGGTLGAEVYRNATRGSQWIASVVHQCHVP